MWQQLQSGPPRPAALHLSAPISRCLAASTYPWQLDQKRLASTTSANGDDKNGDDGDDGGDDGGWPSGTTIIRRQVGNKAGNMQERGGAKAGNRSEPGRKHAGHRQETSGAQAGSKQEPCRKPAGHKQETSGEPTEIRSGTCKNTCKEQAGASLP
eukprot:7948457-Alexandrium_andersonii.AAC.1